MSMKLADATSEAIKAVPPVAVVATSAVADMTLQSWVFVATLAYIALQAAWLMWKWWKAAFTKGWTPDD